MGNDEKSLVQTIESETTKEKNEIININVGYHEEYVQRVNKGKVGLIVLIDQQGAYEKKENDTGTTRCLRALLNGVSKKKITETDKEKLTGGATADSGVNEQILEDKLSHAFKSEELVLKRIFSDKYENLDDFLNKKADSLYEYTGYEVGSSEETSKDLIISLSRAQLEPDSLSEIEKGKVLEESPAITYEISIYKDNLESSSPDGKNFSGGRFVVISITSVILLILTFFVYRYRLLQRLVKRIRRFFSSSN